MCSVDALQPALIKDIICYIEVKGKTSAQTTLVCQPCQSKQPFFEERDIIRQINTEVLCNCMCCYSLSSHISTLRKKELNLKQTQTTPMLFHFFIAWRENEILRKWVS